MRPLFSVYFYEDAKKNLKYNEVVVGLAEERYYLIQSQKAWDEFNALSDIADIRFFAEDIREWRKRICSLKYSSLVTSPA